MPLTMNSLLAVAVKRGSVQGFTADRIAAPGSALFDGSPAFVLVAPITVRGAVTAVLYADDVGKPASEAAVEDRVGAVEATLEEEV